jgi:hypothetical protein
MDDVRATRALTDLTPDDVDGIAFCWHARRYV